MSNFEMRDEIKEREQIGRQLSQIMISCYLLS